MIQIDEFLRSSPIKLCRFFLGRVFDDSGDRSVRKCVFVLFINLLLCISIYRLCLLFGFALIVGCSWLFQKIRHYCFKDVIDVVQ